MPDGAPAADFETGCESCMRFGDIRSGEFNWYDETDSDVPEDEHGELWCCKDCGDYGVKQGTLRFKEAGWPKSD